MIPYVVLGGAQIAVGAAAIFARYALGDAGPLAVAAARLSVAALVLLVLALFVRLGAPRRQSGRQSGKRWWSRMRSAYDTGTRGDLVRDPAIRVPLTHAQEVILVCAGIALAVHFATWIWSLEYTTVAISTLLVTSTPIWTAIYDTLVLGRRLSRLALMGFGGGALGLITVVGFDTTAAPTPGHAWLGATLAFAGSLAIGAYLLLVREVRAKLGTRAIVTRTYTWAAVALLLAAAAARQPPPPLHAAAAWGGILAMALISQLLGHTALNASLRWFSPSAVSFATLLEPLIAASLALLLFRESLPWIAVLGAIVLLASVAVVMREERLSNIPA